MIIPTTLFGVAAIVALVIPGLIYAAVRTSLSGYSASDKSVTTRVLQAVMLSVLLDSIYLIAFGGSLFALAPQGGIQLPHPRLLGLLTLLLGVILPALVAYVRYSQAAWVDGVRDRVRRVLESEAFRWSLPRTGYRNVPTAWDWIAAQKNYKWIRVLNSQGRWIGGWSTDDAFFSSYPEARDLYIAEEWDVDDEGRFLARSERTSGVWLSLEGAQLVEWLEPEGGDTGWQKELPRRAGGSPRVRPSAVRLSPRALSRAFPRR